MVAIENDEKKEEIIFLCYFLCQVFEMKRPVIINLFIAKFRKHIGIIGI